jgi:hypothetical protein
MRHNPVADVLLIAVAVVVVAAPMILAAYMVAELTKRPRFSLRSLLIGTTLLAVLLGIVGSALR